MSKMSTDIVVCPMTDSDLDEVLAIESDSFPHPWSKTHFRDELSSPHSFPLVAMNQDGMVVGYICPMLLLDEGHILNVAVRGDFKGHGIGKLLGKGFSGIAGKGAPPSFPWRCDPPTGRHYHSTGGWDLSKRGCARDIMKMAKMPF